MKEEDKGGGGLGELKRVGTVGSSIENKRGVAQKGVGAVRRMGEAEKKGKTSSRIIPSSHKLNEKEASSSGVRTVVKKSVTTLSKGTSVKIKEKKKKQVFTLPGQKHEAPEERDPVRIFYESLHQQTPESEMAEVWMMEHGLLEHGHAKKAAERKQRRQQHEKNGTPIKSSAPSRDLSSKSGNKSQSGIKSVSGNKPSIANGKSKVIVEQKVKRKREYSSDDDDFIAKPVKRKLKP